MTFHAICARTRTDGAAATFEPNRRRQDLVAIADGDNITVAARTG